MALNIRNPEAVRLADTMRAVYRADVIDSSALLAILQREPERRSFIEAMESADSVRMSVASFVEASIVIETRYGS